MTQGSPSHFREELQRLLTRAASSLDDMIDIRWRYLKRRIGWDGVPKIQPYIGYANQDIVWLHGRVLTNPPAALPADQNHWWENLADSYQRYASDEVPGCEVEIRLGEDTHGVITDAEGYFHIGVRHKFSSGFHGLWTSASMRIVNHPKVVPDESITSCRVMKVPADASYGVISDVDDTILHTGATRLLTMAKLTFLGNARTRLPLPGAASLYSAMQSFGPRANPIFYVSSSPWNLFDLLDEFLEINKIPLGPLLLRDLGFDDNKFLKEGHEHKLQKARKIMSVFPEMPFVLIGDSGQEDASLYATAAEEFRDRVKAIFIRDIDPAETSEHDGRVGAAIERADAVGVPMYLVQDSDSAAEIAVELGLIDAARLDTIRQATATDMERGTVAG